MEKTKLPFDEAKRTAARDRYGIVGTGIGLSTVRKLVEKLGGEIHAHSTTGSGSVFEFSLKKIK